MKICIIGYGNVGSTLGKAWARNGHEIVFGVRDPHSQKTKSLLAEMSGTVSAASLSDAARGVDVVLLATPWNAVREAINSAGDLTGRILVDATNPLLPDLSGLDVGTNSSAGEMVAKWAPGAHVVKCFNTVGANIMANPRFPGGSAALFYCGDDARSKTVVANLASELGFDPLDAGPITQSRLLEPFALLWISLALQYGYTRDIAFQLLRR